jgi:hypothetical protein
MKSSFFYGHNHPLKKSPSYKNRLGEEGGRLPLPLLFICL